MIRLTTDGDTVLIPVKVVPGASRTRLMGELDGRLKVAVSAAPEKGKANDALIAFLARVLGLRRQSLSVVSGHTSPLKSVRVVGLDADEVTRIVADSIQRINRGDRS